MIQSCTCFADVNECITGVNNCNANADCNNTEGSFECTCKPGYSGNGVNCTGDYQLQLQLYSFTFNLQSHDSFHPRIGEPNRSGGRDTQI